MSEQTSLTAVSYWVRQRQLAAEAAAVEGGDDTLLEKQAS